VRVGARVLTRVEALHHALGSRQLRHTVHDALGEGRLGHQPDAGGLQRAEEDVGDELGHGSGRLRIHARCQRGARGWRQQLQRQRERARMGSTCHGGRWAATDSTLLTHRAKPPSRCVSHVQSVAPHAVASCQGLAQQVCVAKTPDGAHQVDGGLVVPGLLVADGVRDVDLEELDAAELEPAWALTVSQYLCRETKY
jgi:hypothetical protein